MSANVVRSFRTICCPYVWDHADQKDFLPLIKGSGNPLSSHRLLKLSAVFPDMISSKSFRGFFKKSVKSVFCDSSSENVNGKMWNLRYRPASESPVILEYSRRPLSVTRNLYSFSNWS